MMPNQLTTMLRSLRQRRAYAAIAIGLMGLGVGATTAIFSVADVALLRPLPYPEPGRLHSLKALEPVNQDSSVAYNLAPLQFTRWRGESRSFTSIEGAAPRPITITGDGDPESLPGMRVSAGLFALLGAVPAKGRWFARDEEQTSSTVAIVSHEFWQTRLASAPDVIGKTVVLDGIGRTIVGVLPEGFSVLLVQADLFLPLPLEPAQMSSRYRGIVTIGRLSPALSPTQAVEELNRINAAIAAEVPQFARTRARAMELRTEMFGSDAASLAVVIVASTILLLIAAANVLNLALTDALARRHATMTRLALGAGARHIVRERLIEWSAIAVATFGVGLLLGREAIVVVQGVDPLLFQGYGGLALDGRTVAFAAIVSTLVVGAIALPVAFGESRVSIRGLAGAAVRSVGGRRDTAVREGLLTAQVALTLVLLLGAALLARNLQSLMGAPLGFSPEGLVTVKMGMPARYATSADRVAYLERLTQALEGLPDVAAASAAQMQFTLGSSSQSFFAIAGVPTPDSTGQIANIRHMMPGLLELLKVRLLQGRVIEATDRAATTPVAVVSASFARQHLGGRALGARLRRTTLPDAQWMEVVGVVEDIRDAGVGVDVGPTVYVPYTQENQAVVTMALLLRLRSPEARLGRSAHAAIWSVDPAQAINRVVSIDELHRESTAQPRFQMLVVALFGAAALLLVLGGIYALTLFAILQRTREIGVRAALGATPERLVRTSLWAGFRPVVLGMAAGALLALPAMSVMQHLLRTGLGVADVPLLGAMALGLLLTTALAALIPARRAAGIAPLVAMRGEG